MRTALDAKLAQLQSVSRIQDAVAIVEVENQVEDVAYQQGQEVPYNLTDSEKLKYSNESKTYSHRVATLEKHHGNYFGETSWQCVCTHLRTVHTNLAGQNEARKELGNCKCLLQATGAL